jgi:hypothetical protein
MGLSSDWGDYSASSMIGVRWKPARRRRPVQTHPNSRSPSRQRFGRSFRSRPDPPISGHSRGEDGPSLYLMFNADRELLDFVLPVPPQPGIWRVAVDTAQPSPGDSHVTGEAGVLSKSDGLCCCAALRRDPAGGDRRKLTGCQRVSERLIQVKRTFSTIC